MILTTNRTLHHNDNECFPYSQDAFKKIDETHITLTNQFILTKCRL